MCHPIRIDIGEFLSIGVGRAGFRRRTSPHSLSHGGETRIGSFRSMADLVEMIVGSALTRRCEILLHRQWYLRQSLSESDCRHGRVTAPNGNELAKSCAP